MVRDALDDASVETCWINFPDPWPKKRHQRRRLLQPGFVAALSRRLVPGGALHAATDHAGYAEQIDAVLAAEPLLENALAAPFVREVPGRLHTAYEEMWRAEGRALHFFQLPRGPHERTAHARAGEPEGLLAGRRCESASPPTGSRPGAPTRSRSGSTRAASRTRERLDGSAARAARGARRALRDARARGDVARPLGGRHAEGGARGARRRRARGRGDPRGRAHHALRLDAGRLPARVLVLRDGHARADAQSDHGRDRRPAGPDAGARAGASHHERGVHGDGRAAAEPARGDRGRAHARAREGLRLRAATRDGLDRGRGAAHRRAARGGAGEPRGLAPRHHRRGARRAGAAQQALPARRAARRAPAHPTALAAPSGVRRVHAHGGRERRGRGREAPGRRCCTGSPPR